MTTPTGRIGRQFLGQDGQVERGVLAQPDGERLVRRPVPVEARGVVAAQLTDLVARPEPRGDRQQLDGEVEVTLASTARRSAWRSCGHAGPGGLGPSVVARWTNRRQPSVR